MFSCGETRLLFETGLPNGPLLTLPSSCWGSPPSNSWVVVPRRPACLVPGTAVDWRVPATTGKAVEGVRPGASGPDHGQRRLCASRRVGRRRGRSGAQGHYFAGQCLQSRSALPVPRSWGFEGTQMSVCSSPRRRQLWLEPGPGHEVNCLGRPARRFRAKMGSPPSRWLCAPLRYEHWGPGLPRYLCFYTVPKPATSSSHGRPRYLGRCLLLPATTTPGRDGVPTL